MNKQTPSTPTVAPAPSLFEKNKLRIAGALNALGDISLLYGAWKNGKHLKTIAGSLYTLGAAVITFFGSTSRDEQISDLELRSAEFIESSKSANSVNTTAAKILASQDAGFLTRTGKYLRRHSAQIMLGFYTAGAAFMLASGIHDFSKDRAKESPTEYSWNDYSGIGLGGFSLLVKLISLAMPEKRAKHSKTAEGEKTMLDIASEKPMRIFGYGSMLTEAFWGWETYKKFKNKEDWKWDAITGGSYIVSDLVIANTNKDAANAVGKLTDAEQHKIEEMMAETLSYHTADKREKLANEAATFLEQESLVNGTRENLRSALLKRAEKLWTDRQQTATTETSGTLQRA